MEPRRIVIGSRAGGDQLGTLPGETHVRAGGKTWEGKGDVEGGKGVPWGER